MLELADGDFKAAMIKMLHQATSSMLEKKMEESQQKKQETSVNNR